MFRGSRAVLPDRPPNVRAHRRRANEVSEGTDAKRQRPSLDQIADLILGLPNLLKGIA